MDRRGGPKVPSRFVLLLLLIFCVMLLFFSYATGFSGGPLKLAADYVFVPMQRGMAGVGNRIYEAMREGRTKRELAIENESLKRRVDELEKRLTSIELQEGELNELRKLYKLDQRYSKYKTVGAYVISRSASNWFNTFTIDKGSVDGIQVDMNVIAGSGLVGIVTEVGRHYAVVRSIIDDTSNVSAMVLSTKDYCIVGGNLKRMSESSMIDFSSLEDASDKVEEGDRLVTSNISDKYLQGLLIGYISNVSEEKGAKKKKGSVTPVVDFKHLSEVLVIKELKNPAELQKKQQGGKAKTDKSKETGGGKQ